MGERAYLLVYDCEHEDYDLPSVIEEYGTFWTCFPRTWIVVTEDTAEQIVDNLKLHIDEDVYLLVTEIGADYQGLIDESEWEWFKENVDRESSTSVVTPDPGIVSPSLIALKDGLREWDE